jgi:hypothetical protein
MESELLDSFANFGVRENYYMINDTLNVNSFKVLTSINMNFYQVWCIFGKIPFIYKDINGNNIYEWRIQGPNSDFCIRNKKKETKLLKIKEWEIYTNVIEQIYIQNFMEHLFDAIKCYELYYKGIEKNIYESSDPYINEILKSIKDELINYRDILNQL